VFNVADCAITFGVAALLYDALLRGEEKPAARPGKPGAGNET
jgi:lipoprotein signal peptidase